MSRHYARDGSITITNDETGETMVLPAGTSQVDADAAAIAFLPPEPPPPRDMLKEIDALKAALVKKGVVSDAEIAAEAIAADALLKVSPA